MGSKSERLTTPSPRKTGRATARDAAVEYEARLRIIAGEFRSRKIFSMPGTDVRPTPDRLRESLFSILNPLIDGVVFVDAYAGTGVVGIEALSRGAKHAIFLEKDKHAIDLIRQNLASLGLEARARVIHGAAHLYLGGLDADMVFLDPPYPKEREYQASLDVLAAKPPNLTIVQHSVRFALDESYGALERFRLLKQRDNALSFYRAAPEPPGLPTPSGNI